MEPIGARSWSDVIVVDRAGLMPRHLSERRRDLWIALALFFVALWVYLGRVHETEFHRDEARWIHRAHYAREFFDPFGSRWEDGYLTRAQPPLANYLMGIGLAAQGRDLETNGLWDFTHGEEWNVAQGNMPEPADLVAGRRTNAFVGALTVVVLYFLGKRLSNRVGGATAALILIPHPLMVRLSSQAMSDVLLTFIVAITALAACSLATRPSWSRALLLGILLGLGGAAKLSPLLVSLPLAAVGVILLLHGSLPPGRADAAYFRAGRPLGWKLLALPLIAYATFVAAYPYLWPDPLTRTRYLFEFRAQEMESQGNIWSNLEVSGPVEALGRVQRTLGERLSTTGWVATQIEERFAIPWHPQNLDLLLAVPGAAILAVLAIAYGFRSVYAMAGIVLAAQVAIIILGLRADFDRYHLPIALVVALGVGLLIGYAWVALRALLLAAQAEAAPSRRIVDLRPRPVVVAQAPSPREPVRRPVLPVLLAILVGIGLVAGSVWGGLRALREQPRLR